MPSSDKAVTVLEEIAQGIHNRKRKFEASQPHRRAAIMGGCAILLLLFISIILGNNTVMTWLGTYSLGYLVLMAVGGLGMGLAIACLAPVFNIHHVNGMESHINEIRTRINYNRMLSESSTDYHLMQ